jgi:hypothetical protein
LGLLTTFLILFNFLIMKKLFCVLSVAAAMVLAPLAANAQSADVTASVTIGDALIIKKATDLSFGAITSGATVGTVAIATDGTQTVTGGVTKGTTGNLPYVASFSITGTTTGTTYYVNLPASVILANKNNSAGMSATLVGKSIASGLQTSGSLTSTSGYTDTYLIGGTLSVPVSATAGTYSGLFNVVFTYN